jgi:4-hydroxybutyrate CoA-transferase
MVDVHQFFSAGQRVYVAGSSNEPKGLLDHLASAPLPDGLNFLHFPLPGLNVTDFTALNSTAVVTTFFMSSTLAKADPARVQFLPMQMRAVFDYLSQGIDVALLQVAFDRDGVLRMGPNVDFNAGVLGAAKTVIAELNRGLVAPLGSIAVDPAQIDYFYETNRMLTPMPEASIDDAARSIGRQVAELIKDGDCLQTGIGAIPAAILGQLTEKNDLGLHGGLIDSGGQKLIQGGQVTGARKAIDQGRHVTGMALGGTDFNDWLADTPEVVFRGADYTHEVAVIRQLEGFVSVNSAVEVDLLGHVNAEYAGGRQISGTGGSVDFMRAAKASKCGRSIVAMTSTARGGSVSRIVPRVEMVTALRTDVDIVVTEYGVAQIKNLPVRARAEALIQIAAPEFRDELSESLDQL